MYRHRLFSLAVAAAVYAVAAACSETLPEGRACPALCPNQNIPVVDTVIDGLTAMAVDTTIAGYPLLGTEPELLVAASGDTIDVRAIVRFDSITTQYRPTTSDTLQPVTHVYNAYLRLVFDTLSFRPRASNSGEPTLAVYDVDTVGSDTSVGVLASLFRPDRLLGSQSIGIGADSVRIQLDTAKIRAHVTGDHNIRVGIRLTHIGVGPADGRLNILNATSGTPPVFSYQADTDTVTASSIPPAEPRSTTPTGDSALAQRLLNYPLVVSGTSPPVGQHLDIGGMPARRTFVRFVLPAKIIDSGTVVRATLTLHLIPNSRRAFFQSPPDSMGVLAAGIVSTPAVTDPGHAAGFNAPSTVVGIDTSFYGLQYPDSVNVEFVNAARHWKGRAADTVSRAIVLMGTKEGATPLVASFYPALPSVPIALRPHVHLAYVNTVGFGLP